MTLLGSTKCKSLSNTENTANNPKSQQLSHYLLKKPDFFIFLLFMDQTVIIFYIYTKFIIFFLLHALLEEAFIVKQTTTLKENKWGTERAGEELNDRERMGRGRKTTQAESRWCEDDVVDDEDGEKRRNDFKSCTCETSVWSCEQL